MRVTSEFWVSALVRRVFADGGFAAIMRRGAPEAGAIFVVVRRGAEVSLLSPAPQADYAEAHPEDRAFTMLPGQSEKEIDGKLAREARFDPDFWVLEIEPGKTPLESLLTIMPG